MITLAFYAFKQIEVGSIAAGNTSSGSWTADDDYVIKKIFIKEVTETAVGLQFLNCTFRVDNYTFTKDEVRAILLSGWQNQIPELNITLSKGQTFYYSITNEHSSSAIEPVIILELEK